VTKSVGQLDSLIGGVGVCTTETFFEPVFHDFPPFARFGLAI
jgi:hypothetical protein